MKTNIDKDQLLQILGPCQGLIEKRNVTPILSKILVKFEDQKLKLYATDQENSLQSFISAKGEDGAICVDSRHLFEIVKELPKGEILLEKPSKKEALRIKTASSLFDMVGVNPADFPVFPNLEKPSFFSLKSENLASLIYQTSYCISTDETRYHLNGILCEKKSNALSFVATDGHRLSYAKQKLETPFSIPKGTIIPRKGLIEIQRLLSTGLCEDVEMAIEPPRVLVRYGSFLLSIRLIEGKYPNYSQLIPKQSKIEVRMQKELLTQGLKRASVLSSLQSKNVHFQWEKKKLILKASHHSSGSAKEEIPVIKSDGEINIRFNARYVLEALNHIEDDEVVWKLNSSSAPGMITTQDGIAIIMPMKL